MTSANKRLRVFGITSGAAIGLMFGIIFPLLQTGLLPLWPWVVAGMLWVCAIMFPGALSPLQTLMHFTGVCIFGLVNWIVLGLFYFFFLVPYSLALRMAGKTDIAKKYRSDDKTYFIEPTNRKPVDFKRPF
jgi:hypothetical protein